jgi:nicotinamidase-related amidase
MSTNSPISGSLPGPGPMMSPATPPPMKLWRKQTLFLCVDIQERLLSAMPEELVQRLRKNAATLLRGAQALGVPVLVSEQYKKGLGELPPELVAALPAGTPRFEKLAFSAFADAAIARALVDHAAAGRTELVVFGMETHICVYQTVRDLTHAGFAVHVPHDAVSSRDPENLRVGLVLCERAGATVTSTETVLFDLLEVAGSPEFKTVSSLVK